MTTYYLIYDGQVSGTVEDPSNFPLPSEDWSVLEGPDLALSKVRYQDGQIVPAEPTQSFEPPLATEVIRFSGTELFQLARTAARDNPAVTAEFTTALFAESQGDYQLLQNTIQALEELLT